MQIRANTTLRQIALLATATCFAAFLLVSPVFGVQLGKLQAETFTESSAYITTQSSSTAENGQLLRWEYSAPTTARANVLYSPSASVEEMKVRAKSATGVEDLAIFMDGTASSNRIGTVSNPPSTVYETYTVNVNIPAGQHRFYFGPASALSSDQRIAFDVVSFEDTTVEDTTVILDADGDGVADSSDNCPNVANAAQADTDADGAGDACDSTDNRDADGDGVADGSDNCVDAANAGQTDLDGDGLGDACDSDKDNDGVANTADNCPSNINTDQADVDGDGLGDACDSTDDPTTMINVPAHDTRYPNGVTKLRLDNAKDYIVKLPPEKKVGGLQIYGGDSIKIIGGHITANPDRLTDNSVRSPVSIYVEKTTDGPVHIEGVLIDDSAGGQIDAINPNAPNATVTLKNIRAIVSGRADQWHASCISGFNDVGRLNVDGYTCYTNLHGFYFQGNGPVNIKNANVRYRESPFMPGAYGGKAFAITKENATACTTQGMTISGPVYVYPPRPGLEAPERYTWPNTKKPAGCLSAVNGNVVTWSNLPNVSGGVSLTAPPAGDFVPAGMAGVGYTAGG